MESESRNIKRAAVIVAGGKGLRAGGELPKQFQKIAGLTVIGMTIAAFSDFDKGMQIVVVTHPDYMELMRNIIQAGNYPNPIVLVEGGKTRADSVYNGLKAIRYESNEDCIVAIHDAARPFVAPDLLDRGFVAVDNGIGAIPAIAPVNSLRKLLSKTEHGNDASAPDERDSESVIRSEYVEVQTPQIFLLNDIIRAYELAENGSEGDLSGYTDDASVAEAAGMKVRLYEGSPMNIKITHPIDFKIGEAIMQSR